MIKRSMLLMLAVYFIMGFAVSNLQASSSKYMFVWVSNLRLRSAPNLSSTTVGYIKEGGRVEYLGQKSSKAITITLRGKRVSAPFFKVKTAQGRIGWAFGGALSNYLAASYKRRVIKSIAKSVAVVKRIVAGISKFKLFSIGDPLAAGFCTSDKGALLKQVKGGYTQVGNVIAKYYFQRGLFVDYVNEGYNCYYVNNFPKLNNGIRPGLTMSQVKNILGANPIFKTANLLYYFHEGSMQIGMDQKIVLFFRNGKLFAIKVSYGLGC